LKQSRFQNSPVVVKVNSKNIIATVDVKMTPFLKSDLQLFDHLFSHKINRSPLVLFFSFYLISCIASTWNKPSFLVAAW
jgi:hypothetical protein